MISDLADQGIAIILISSEMPELLGMCDRIVVLNEGRQAQTFACGEASDGEKVLDAATQSLEAERQSRGARRPKRRRPRRPAADAGVACASSSSDASWGCFVAILASSFR